MEKGAGGEKLLTTIRVGYRIGYIKEIGTKKLEKTPGFFSRGLLTRKTWQGVSATKCVKCFWTQWWKIVLVVKSGSQCKEVRHSILISYIC